ncbi:MAG: hypothetical protein ACRC7O_07000, partial [Fimbriiglobus sp.]
QRPMVLPGYGWGEKVGWVADLRPEHRAEARAALGHDLAIGYLYETFFVSGPSLVFWTYPGKYVLFDGNTVYFPDDAEWDAVCGPGGRDRLGTPLAYNFPVGWLVVLGMTVFIALAVRYSPISRANRMLNSAVYQEALGVYATALPADAEPTRDDRRAALDKAVAFLGETHGIDPLKAAKHLRLLIGEVERSHSQDLRFQGAQFEEAGVWASAADCYLRAAEMMQEWDEQDAAFLRKCVARVRAKLPKSTE